VKITDLDISLDHMGLFSRQRRDEGPLPPAIATLMEERGRVRSEGFKTELTDAQEQDFLSLSQGEQEGYVDALAEAVLPLGGWAVLGAADLVVKAVFEPEDRPSYVGLLLAALELKRAVRVSDIALSMYEKDFWQQHNPGRDWLEPKSPPTRAGALITPLAIGEERRVGQHTSAPSSNLVLVRRTAEDRYLALVDQEVERGEPARGRVEAPMREADNLYDIFVFLGESPLASFWNHEELEPFCVYDRPRDGNLPSHPPL
jgi:hypothetical protein